MVIEAQEVIIMRIEEEEIENRMKELVRMGGVAIEIIRRRKIMMVGDEEIEIEVISLIRMKMIRTIIEEVIGVIGVIVIIEKIGTMIGTMIETMIGTMIGTMEINIKVHSRRKTISTKEEETEITTLIDQTIATTTITEIIITTEEDSNIEIIIGRDRVMDTIIEVGIIKIIIEPTNKETETIRNKKSTPLIHRTRLEINPHRNKNQNQKLKLLRKNLWLLSHRVKNAGLR